MGTRTITIDLPTELADKLAQMPDPDVYVTRALHARESARQIAMDQIASMLAEHGIVVTREGVERWRRRLYDRRRTRLPYSNG